MDCISCQTWFLMALNLVLPTQLTCFPVHMPAHELSGLNDRNSLLPQKGTCSVIRRGRKGREEKGGGRSVAALHVTFTNCFDVACFLTFWCMF